LTGACADLLSKIDDGYLRHADRETNAPLPSPERLFLSWPELMDRTNGWPTLALEPLTASDASWNPIQTFPAQIPASAGLGARGMPFSQTLAIMDRLREVPRGARREKSRPSGSLAGALTRTRCAGDGMDSGSLDASVKPKRRFTSCTAICPRDSSPRTCPLYPF
jgi:hypothetical protein